MYEKQKNRKKLKHPDMESPTNEDGLNQSNLDVLGKVVSSIKPALITSTG